MNRGRTLLPVVLGLVLAAVIASAALAEPPPYRNGPQAGAAPAVHTIAGTVRIAGVRVGGLTPSEATAAVRSAFTQPLPVVVDGQKVELRPAKLATAYLDAAVAHARSATPGTNVRLIVSVQGAAVRDAVAHVAKRFDVRGKNAGLALEQGVPHLSKEVEGHRLDQGALVARIVRALNANVRLALNVKTRAVKPQVTAAELGPMILINREKNQLYLFHPDNELWRTFPVATGQAIYPTPRGRFDIVVKWVDPWWYPPTNDDWAKGLSPVPPGPGNPLGTRWMGLSAPGVGIHGTDAPGSIGYSASHGCIRMQVVDSEWLFERVRVGTTVFIV